MRRTVFPLSPFSSLLTQFVPDRLVFRPDAPRREAAELLLAHEGELGGERAGVLEEEPLEGAADLVVREGDGLGRVPLHRRAVAGGERRAPAPVHVVGVRPDAGVALDRARRPVLAVERDAE